VQSFKYLGFVLSKNGSYRECKRAAKGRLAAKRVWGLGEKICRNDFKRRWNLFKYLVQSVMEYGVEIWGWEEKIELERVMYDYIRWMFGLDFCTSRYLISRELGMLKLRVAWGLRAKRYEKRIKLGIAGSIAKDCWEEKRGYNWEDSYGEERDRYLNRIGWK